MRNFTFQRFKLFKLFFLVSLFFVSFKTRAQFPYSQSFKNSTAPGVLFGGSPVAFLTGGAGTKDGYTDANGSGYLRLTNNQGNQKGIVYSNTYSFPSAYGMTISFEYFAHSKTSGSGADGIAFILFDATASPVEVGAFGGSLGYAQRNTETGFSKGYLGIGIDEFGNFSAANEGKTGGAGVLSSNVTLRGAGTGTTGYRHLISSQTTALASPFNVAGNDRTATDNTKNGYRKMEVVLRPRSTGGFFIDVYLTHGSVRDLIINNYAYTDAAPSNLKFAISSSTGGSNNFHEIRNLNITVDQSTLLKPVANADEFTGCIGVTATSGDITANDNGAVNTLGSVNKTTIDLDPSTAGVQTSYTVVNKGTFTYDSTTGAVTFIPLNSSVTGPITINYTFNDNYNKTSNTSTITYKTYNAITNNVITAPLQSTFCNSPANPDPINGSTATVAGGTITYQWETSSDNAVFSPISGATNDSYDPPSTSTTAYYRRIASSANCKNTSNTVAIVFGKASTPTATAATAITCNSFTANWNTVPNATSYGLSVSTNSNFSSHVANYDGRDLTSSNSFTVNNLTSGQTYYFKVWPYNSCGVGDTASNVITVTVGNGSVAGTASSAQNICSGTSPADLTLTGYTGTIQWQSSINNSTFNNILGATGPVLTSSQIGSLSTSTYYRAVVTSGSCTAANTSSVLITVNAVPVLGTATQSATVCDGSTARINLTGLLANTTSTISYSIDGIAQAPVTGITADAAGAGAFDSAVLTAANNGKTLKITAVTTTSTTPNCTSTVNKDVTLSVNASSVGGTVTSAQTICSGTSPADLVLNGNTGNVTKWQKASDATFTNPSDITSTSTTLTKAIIGNLAANTYFRAVVQNGICSAAFSASVLITVNATPAAPSASTQNFCSVDAKKVSDLLPYGASYKWYNASSAGTLYTGTETLATGTYYVSQTSNGCESSRTAVSVTVNITPSAPSASAQVFCSADSKKVSDLLPSGSSYKWYNASSAGTLYTGTETLATGTYYVSQTTNGCESSRTAVSVTVNTTPGAPTVGTITQPTCSTATGSFTIGNYSASNTYTITPSAGVSRNAGTVTAPEGNYTISASANGCTSANASFTINAQPATPGAPTVGTITQPTCSTATGSYTIGNYSASNTYTITPSAGVTRNAGVVTAPEGNYTISASANGCTSANASFTINAQPATPEVPTVGTITQPTCSTATGSFTIGNYSASNTYTITPSAGVTRNAGVVTAPEGNYTISASANGCTSANASFTINAQPATPGVPTVGTITQPTCSTATGSFTIGNYSASNTYTIIPSAGVTRNAGAVTAPEGNYTISASANGCTSANASFTINAQPATPEVPTVGTITQPTCSTATGSFTITNYNSNYTYLVSPSAGVTITGNTISAPSGSYLVKASLNGCESTGTNAVVYSQICAVSETFTPAINGLTGGNTTASLIAGDKLNNAQAAIGSSAGEVIISPVAIPTGFLINADGTVKVPANTKAGNYNIEYSICEASNPSNCSTAISIVQVSAPVIDAVDDTITAINGNIGGTTISLTTNDTLNGNPFVLGTNPGEVTLNIIGILPAGMTLNANGTITVAPNTPSGNYNVEYRICENTNSSNCDSVIIVVPVTAGDLVANPDTVTSVLGSNTPQTFVNVLDNDTKNGVKLNPSDVTLSVSTPDPKGYLSLDSNGNVVLGANAPAGDYELTYTICEKLNSGNCKSNTVTVKVGMPIIDAVIDTISPINGNTGGTTISLIANDTLNGNPFVLGANPGEVTLNIIGILPAGLTLNANGTITVAPNTPSGNYNVEYRICENTNSSNCDSVIIVVPVTAGDLVANPDTVTSVLGSNTPQTFVNVLDNDTKNGVKLNPSDVTLSVSTPDPKGYLSLDSNGNVVLGANPPAGDYELTYTICEKLNSGNCKSNTVTVKVGMPVIDAVIDTISPINGNIGGTTISLIANDTLNGNPFVLGTNPGEVTLNITGTLPAGLTLNANGTITVAPNTPSGNYNVEYRICENTNSSNCDSVIIVVPVTAGDLVANPDTVTSVLGSNTPQTFVNVLDNDTKNGVKLNPSDVTLSVFTPDPKGYLTLNPDGTLALGANPPAGDYELTYTICEKLNSGNCKSNTVTVKVGMPVIDAVVETLTPSINGSIGGTTTTSVIDNDTLNGNPVTIGNLDGQIKLTAVNVPTGLTLNANGTVTVAANTTSGIYDIEYRICEITNPSNCDTAIAKVAVNNGVLVANMDVISSVTPSNVPQTLGNVFDNDTKNGVALNPSDVNLTISTPDPKAQLTVNPDGTVTLGANSPAGNYEVIYTICEKLNPGNCSSNTVRVTVSSFVIDAVEETLIPSINGSIGGTTTSSVIDNDTLNGVPVVIGNLDGQVKLTALNVPTGFTLNANGTITVAVNTQSGIYNIEYSICEITNPSNCDSAISKVAVNNGVLVANSDTVPSVKTSASTQNLGVNVLDNDTKNGVALNPSDVNLTISTPDPKGYLTVNPDGSVSLGANAPVGDYELTYTICEKLNPGNCSSNTVRVTVDSVIVANIDAVPSAVGIKISQTLINVFANDTKDGIALIPSDVILSTTVVDPKGYLKLDANGNAVLAPNAPAGNYELTYTICDKLNTSNCSSNIVRVTVAEPTMQVIANSYCSNNVPYVNYTVTPNNFTALNQLTIKWIDSANNVVATQTNLPLSGNVIWPGAVVDANGNGTDWPGWVLNNGQWTESADGFELTRNGVKMEFSVNPTVLVSVAYPAATAGCNARPTFSIIANNDNYGPIDTKKGASPSINIFANDLVNGVQPNPSAVILTTIEANPNIVLNADGSVSIASNTPNGTYELTYQICDATNASNCSQPAVIIIKIVNSVDPISPSTPNQITLGNDTNISADGINGSLEFVNVLDNDLINGQPINPADVVVKPLIPDAYFEWNADGTVSVKPNTPGKTYTLTYQVCEKANPSNCSTATLTVFVEVPGIAVVKKATFNDENKNNFANAGETITYEFTITNTGNVPLTGITINDPLPGVVVSGQAIDLGVNESNETNFKAVYKITQEDINRGSISNQAIAKGSSSRGVSVEDQSDDSSNTGDNPTVINLDGCSIKVLNAFSPNGDKKNERFYIRGIECYPENTVEIYNRWGVLVFSIDQYNNEDRAFRGYSNGRSTIKQTDGLPVGTYFYILKYSDSAKTPHEQSGYLYINK